MSNKKKSQFNITVNLPEPTIAQQKVALSVLLGHGRFGFSKAAKEIIAEVLAKQAKERESER